MVTICVDAMGGDEEPQVVLQGIGAALAADADLAVLVAGNAEYVEPFAAKHDRVKALVTTEVIEMGEHPADAVRTKRDSSIVRGCAAVRAGEADGFFSAGSTGAIFAAATLGVGRIRGVKRPAIASPMPGATGKPTVFLDMGANADVRPEMIVQFAQMGRAYAKVTLGVEDPRVALLSNGTEDTKGSEAVVAEHEALAAAADGWFAGNCEGKDILAGTYDVIVTDGFTGNVALKTLEGTAKFLLEQIRQVAHSSKKAGLGALLMKSSLKGVAKELSGDAYGGAMLLGCKAPVLIGHGATSVEAVKNGTLAAARAVRSDLVGRVAAELAGSK
ncbi:MAG: phosphate acyltransferase PlsX [Olegusella sp.]|nr:phosphate acyltransferase PlsX [Olegusella sp.]